MSDHSSTRRSTEPPGGRRNAAQRGGAGGGRRPGGHTPNRQQPVSQMFEPYASREDVQSGLKRDELIESNIRINPKNYEDAYISSPDGGTDVYISGVLDRNRALAGDKVVVKLKPQTQWKICHDALLDSMMNIFTSEEFQLLYQDPQMAKDMEAKFSQMGGVYRAGGAAGVPDFKPDKKPSPVNNSVSNPGAVVAPHELLEAEEVSDASGESDVDVDELAESLKNDLDIPIISTSSKPEPVVKLDVGGQWGAGNVPVSGKDWTSDQHNSTVINCADIPCTVISTPKSSKDKPKDARTPPRRRDGTHLMGMELGLSVEDVLRLPAAKRYVQKVGQVVYISDKKHTRAAAGNLKLMPDKNRDYALFSPSDHAVPRMKIPAKQCPHDLFTAPNNYKQSLFVARITKWESVNFALGTLCRSLGEAGEVEPETEAMLVEYGIDTAEFSDEVNECLPIFPYTIKPEEISSRTDFRRECVFTIDPATARDLDDAMSVHDHGDGTYSVGVHIADVSFFIGEGTELDQVASRRATTYYLVQKVIPMLPRPLCEHLCSLNPGEDKLTFSVVWKMDENGNIKNQWIGRSVIRSCAKLSYEHAQEMIDSDMAKLDPQQFPTLYGDFPLTQIASKVKILNRLGMALNAKRAANGYLRLDQVKVQFHINWDTGLPTGFSAYDRKPSHKLIEEFMLLANMSIAHEIYRAYPDHAILRRHAEPKTKMLDDCIEMFGKIGIHLDGTTAGTLETSVHQYTGDDDFSTSRLQVITNMLARPMVMAEYFPSGMIAEECDYHHYALNVPLYTHFTSPIRRYPDVMVHRLLAAALKLKERPTKNITELAKICEACNDAKTTGRSVSDRSRDMFLAVFIKECGPYTSDAIVSAVMDHSFDVLVRDFGVIKRVYTNKLGIEKVEFIKKKGVPHLKLWWRSCEDAPAQEQIISLLTQLRVTLTTSGPLQYLATIQHPALTKQ